ncbi:MAG: type II toxin-antitoxin system VapC family toxin [Propionibacteriaceae bacterium]|jgi:predicted nucleic acid-binding protein|nr:type II toxin-antitoxin system VapC family toxin [Propionibacteriaceae bacterium]
MSLILDASVLAEILVGSRRGRVAEPLLLGHDIHVLELTSVEVVSVFRGWVRAGMVSSTRAAQAIEDLAIFPTHTWPHRPLPPDIWELRDNFSPYDASCVALAQALGFPLLTGDARLAKAMETSGVGSVILVS